MQTQCTGDFSDREGGRRSPCVKPAPFQMQIQCTRDHHRGCGRRRPLGPASGQHRQCITQKNPARPSAPTRHTRQRIKPSMCRLGIGSEQMSDTHQLAAAPASSRHRPRSSSLLQRSPPTGLAKKNSGDAASRACGKRKPMQADAVSDADSMHWRFFGSRGRPKVALRKAGAVSDADSMHSRPSPRRGCGRGRRRPLGPASGQRRRCITQKNPARPSAPTRHTRQRIKPPMCRLGIQSEQTSDTHQLAAAAASCRRSTP